MLTAVTKLAGRHRGRYIDLPLEAASTAFPNGRTWPPVATAGWSPCEILVGSRQRNRRDYLCCDREMLMTFVLVSQLACSMRAR